MANFTGYSPQTLTRFGSKVSYDDNTQLPLGVGDVVRNMQFRSQSTKTRYGLKLLLDIGGAASGFAPLRYVSPISSAQSNVSFIAYRQSDGNILSFSPFTQSSLTQLTDAAFQANANISPTPGLFAQCVQAYNRMYIAQGDNIMGVAPALQVDGATLTIDPISDLPFGATWQPNQNVRVGHVVTAINQNGPAKETLFRCITAGKTGNSEPVWPSIEGETVGDGSAQWQVIDIVVSSGLTPPPAPIFQSTTADGSSAIANGMTVFLVCTWKNQFGESIPLVANPDGTLGNVLQYTNNSGAPVDLNVVLPAIPPDLASLAGQYEVTGCNLYAFFTAGTPDPTEYTDASYYALLGSYSPNEAVTVSAFATGVNPPTTNTAFTTDEGNVSSGTRYMIVLYKTRTGYITGVSDPVPIRCDISLDGRKMLVQNIPVGPYNCVARICAFTVAGQSSAGPYFYIAADDYVDPGEGAAKILQTATLIADNTTTVASFDFIDSYLEGASEVTDYFDRIQIPPASDIYFSKSLNRVIYTGCQGYDHLISDLQDPEAVRVPGSNLAVATADGDRCVCFREMRGVPISFKENSAHAVTPNDGDPQTWAVNELWNGSGPVGPKALDIYNADLQAGEAGQPFAVFAHKEGGYLYVSGSPTLITREVQDDWDSINWEYGTQIKVCIDPIHREIRFHVPTGSSAVNNKTITLNYYWGFGEPVIFSARSGKLIANPEARKWSVDDIAAVEACFVKQRYSFNGTVAGASRSLKSGEKLPKLQLSKLDQPRMSVIGDGETPPPPPPIIPPLVIYTSSLPVAAVGTPYSQQVVVGGGTYPYTFSITAGALPAGLTIDASTGIISGTPTASGTFNFTVTVKDSTTPQKSASATLSISAPSQPFITTASLPQAVVGVAYNAGVQANGGAAPYGFQITNGSLPPGLTLAATGGITGIPTSSGNFTFTIQVYDSNDPQGTNTTTFTVSCAAQSLSNPVAALDAHLLIAGNDGGIYAVQESQFHDDNIAGTAQGYFACWYSVPGQNAKLSLMQLGGATVSGKGSGNLNISAIDARGNTYSLTSDARPFIFDEDDNGNPLETVKDFICRAIPNSERYGIGMDNGGIADAWFEAHIATLYQRPMFAARRA